jgi:hypothetical protein
VRRGCHFSGASGPRTEPTKKPAAVSHPGVMRSFGECSFLEDSRYASQIIFVASKPCSDGAITRALVELIETRRG